MQKHEFREKTPLEPLLTLHFHEDVIARLQKERFIQVVGTGNVLSTAYFGVQMKNATKKKLLWVSPTKSTTTELMSALSHFVPDKYTLFTPADKDKNVQEQVLSFLAWVQDKESDEIAIVTPEMLCLRVPKIDEIASEYIGLTKGVDVSLYILFERLINSGYKQSDDPHLVPGTYRNVGDTLTIFPMNNKHPIRLVFLGDTIEDIIEFNQDTKKIVKGIETIDIFPCVFKKQGGYLVQHIPDDMLVLTDEIDMKELILPNMADGIDQIEAELQALGKRTMHIECTAFPEDDDFVHLRYLSMLRYYTSVDFMNDVKERYIANWKTIILTKHIHEVANMCKENDISLVSDYDQFLENFEKNKPAILIIPAIVGEAQSHSFQNAETKLCVITDREIFLSKKAKKQDSSNALISFLASLKPGDFVVHADHGIGIFQGIDKKTIEDVTREYLEIRYAENDKLFLPTDQADKITKYISNEDKPPKLSRLDSAEWTTINSKVKKETEKIAKELLELYAKRQLAGGHSYPADNDLQEKFEETFQYAETPGQLKAILDVKQDMEAPKAMDRLICGDVGFGKTEVAMRAAFKAVQGKKQVALISPITILADQHYKGFCKRMDAFGIKTEMLSRFKTQKEQTKILKDLESGEIDIIVGTHRLLQSDIHFKDLGLVVVDEEQRFGVKQKEKLKELRCNVDLLTLSATPIPRTLNMSLNKLRDITTITTPPPGRLPIITEVRKYSDKLVADSIRKEIERGGQVYFLHNKVRTIEGVAHKLRNLVPEARFIVSHGQMDPKELEKRIFAFKEKEYDVLISSTIIENGIDLPNANTLIVNNADNFGLSQLYQLRGRVGRSRTQAFTYLLYSSQKLGIDAKKRLRAIVEASELGSGFQIAMKDLEIRGAGDILGSEQHGAMNAVGVSHFIRMLNLMVDELRSRGDNPDVPHIS